MTWLSIERQDDRPDRIRFSATVEYGPDLPAAAGPLRHTFNFYYAEEPDAGRVEADLAALEKTLNIYVAVREQVKDDPRAEDVFIRAPGDVRVLLANRTCPAGCRVDSLDELPEVLARTPAVKPKLSAAEVLQLLKEKTENGN